MILINTTFCVDSPMADTFIDFIKDTYIPLALSSGLHSPLLTRINAGEENSKNELTGAESSSYALQMRAPSADILAEFRADILPNLYYVMGESWGPSIQLFETELEVVYDPAKDGSTD